MKNTVWLIMFFNLCFFSLLTADGLSEVKGKGKNAKKDHAKHRHLNDKLKKRGKNAKEIEKIIKNHVKFRRDLHQARKKWREMKKEERAEFLEKFKERLKKKLKEEGDSDDEIEAQLKNAEKCLEGECDHDGCKDLSEDEEE